MKEYDFQSIEPKWQKYWEKHGTFRAHDFSADKPKYYPLVEFPYPSGAGLHVGHPRPYTALDIVARKRRMEGYNVLYPIGWDAFGLPTENYAIKTGRPPAEVTAENIETFTQQIKSLGISFDWSREVNTTDPSYYKWTQWIFLKLFEHGLAYKANIPINWCLSCKIGLANEEVVEGKCERCGGEVEKRDKEQWMLAITKYADRLLADLDTIDYIERAKVQQRNWIGRSEGVRWVQKIKDFDIEIKAFDSVPQTYMAQTFAVIAADHPLLKTLVEGTEHEGPVMKKAKEILAAKMSDKYDEDKQMEGIFTGRYIEDPFGTGDLPIWVASFAIADYGSGIVNCSAHDERDFAFAKKFDIPLRPVMFPEDKDEAQKVRDLEYCYHHDENAVLAAPEQFAGRKWGEAREDIIAHVESLGIGERAVQYKLRDWVFSRQRYWGEPIPLVKCEPCGGWIPIPIEQLPLTLPEVKKYEPTDTGESPLAAMEDWVNTTCPKCGGPAKRETDTMPNWAGSSWYFLRYCSPDDPEFFTHEKKWKRDAIEPNDHDKAVWQTFMLLRDAFSSAGVRFWVCGSLLINALNRAIWKHMDDLDIHVHSRDYEQAIALLESLGMTMNQRREGSCQMTHGEVDIELIAIDEANGHQYSYYANGQRIVLARNDWELVERGELFGESFSTVSPWHALWQYTYLQKYFEREKEGDEDKKAFLKEYLEDPVNYWMGVDWYNGGMEHTVLHLLYSRFWNKFLFDIGAVPVSEPYNKRTSHGLILAEGGEKMSKSRGNVINPNEIVEQFGADTLRTYEMFIGPFDQHAAWSTKGLVGVHRFLERIWKVQEKVDQVADDQVDSALMQKMHYTIAKVDADIEAMRFNTAIAALMELNNVLMKEEVVPLSVYRTLVQLLSPFAPHLCEELWQTFGDSDVSISKAQWPVVDPTWLVHEEVTIVVQVNGKVRAQVDVSVDIPEDELKALALAEPKVAKWLDGKTPQKIIVVAGKLVSIVV